MLAIIANREGEWDNVITRSLRKFTWFMSKQRAYKETIRGKQNKEKNRCFERERERESMELSVGAKVKKGQKGIK